MTEHHTVLGGKVHVYKRPNSTRWQCSTYLGGKNRRTTTKEDSLSRAKEIAEDWYLQLRGKLRNGEIKTEKTFSEASEQFLREYDLITQGERSKIYVNGLHWRSTRAPGAVLRPLGPLGNHPRQGPGIPNSSPRRSDGQARQAAGPQHHAPRNRNPPADFENRRPQRMARPYCRTFPNPTGHLQKSRTGPGSPLRNTKSSTKPPASAPTSRRRRATNGNRNSFTTLFCSRPTPAFALMKRGGFNSATSQSLKTTRAAKPSLRSRCAASAASATARA